MLPFSLLRASRRRARGAFARCLAVALAVVLVALVVGCDDDDGESASPVAPTERVSAEIRVPSGEPIVIGVSTALTGPVGERGTEYRDAVLLGVQEWRETNGDTIFEHPLEVRSEDDGCTEADQTRVAAERLLVAPGLVGVLGPQCSAGAAAVLPIYAEAGVVAISGSATATALTTEQPAGGYFFRTAFRNDLQGNVVGDFVANTLGVKTAFLVDNGETYGRDLAGSTERFLARDGVSVTRRSAPQRTVDFSELARAIAAADPDAVGYAGFNPDAALFYRQLRDVGYGGAFGAFDAAASATEFVAPLGEIAEGVYFAGCAIELSQDFRDAFTDIHGSPPAAAFNGQYADAVRALLDAVASTAEPGDDGSLTIGRERLRDAVRETAITDGHTGAISFDLAGDRASASSDPADQASDFGLVGCQVTEGQLVQIQGQ
jgi:branched-chain amino acid transport system substrate-binding protein